MAVPFTSDHPECLPGAIYPVPELDAAVALRNAANDLIAELQAARDEATFYRRRCEALQQWQSHMRDPERTIVCDILANGSTLPAGMAGDRYKFKE